MMCVCGKGAGGDVRVFVGAGGLHRMNQESSEEGLPWRPAWTPPNVSAMLSLPPIPPSLLRFKGASVMNPKLFQESHFLVGG